MPSKPPVKPPSKPELSKAGEGLRRPGDLTKKEVQSLSGRVLREGPQDLSTHTTTAAIECGKCHVPLRGPANPKDNDLLTCPRCGGQVKTKVAVDQAGKQFAASVEKQLKDAFRKAGFK